MLAPIVIFAYNRSEHLRHTLAALSENAGATDSEVYVFVDKSKDDKDKLKTDAVRTYLEEFEKNNVFANVTIHYANQHRGLAASVINGVTQIINQYGKVIVLEDDLITSRKFITYMNDALDFYEDKQNIWSVSGYTLPLKELKNYNEDVYLFYRCCSWGWGTWADRWSMNDWEVKDYHKFKKSLLMRHKFNRGGDDLSFMMDRQMIGMIDSWATRWGYNESKLDMYTVYPSKSYVDNTGCDGTGTHFAQSSDRYGTTLSESDYKLVLPTLNKSIIREFHKYHSEPKLKHIVKEFLYHFGLYTVK